MELKASLGPIWAQVSGAPASCHCHAKVTVRCGCGTEASLAARALIRKWAGRPAWLCKSCSVKSYVSAPERVTKFKASFAVTAATPEHRAKCSAAAKKLWAGDRTEFIEYLKGDYAVNPRKQAALRKAQAAFLAGDWRAHLDQIRPLAVKAFLRHLDENPELLATLRARLRLDDPAVKERHRSATGEETRRRWADPEFRAKLLEAFNDPKHVAALSERARQQWQNVDYRARMVAIWADPEFRARLSENSKEVNSRPEIVAMRADPAYAAAASARSKEINSRPEVKLARAAANARQPSISSQERSLAVLLDELGIKHVQQHFIAWYSFDFWLPDHGLLIEVNGEWWHKGRKAEAKDCRKAAYVAKFHAGEYRLRTIWEREFSSPERVKTIVAGWLRPPSPTAFNLDDVVIEASTDLAEARYLLSTYHYLGKLGRQSLIFRARLGGRTTALLTLAPPNRAESASRLGLEQRELLELTRFVIVPGYNQQNFASWMLGRCLRLVRQHKPAARCLLTFADPAFGHAGTIYRAAGWTDDGDAVASYYWCDQDGFAMHKKTIWDAAMKAGLKEADYAARHGYVKVRTPAKRRFLRWL